MNGLRNVTPSLRLSPPWHRQAKGLDAEDQ
jgi:hypothetical protein